MKTKLVFFKQDNRWYADVPNRTLEENEMVIGSDTLLELVSAGKYYKLTFFITDEPSDNYMLAFKIKEHDDDGAYYTISGPLYNVFFNNKSVNGFNEDIPDEIWICNVTHDVFGEHPNEIYVTNILQEILMSDEEMEKELHKEYDKKQCVYGEESTMPCMLCSATCQERYEDFSKKGVKFGFISTDNDNNKNGTNS